MQKETQFRIAKVLVLSAKVGIGASVAIYLAEWLALEYYASAGIIALLSIMATKWGTVKLSVYRLITYVIAVFFCWVLFTHVKDDWIGYGMFLFFMVGMCEWLDLRSTISVNAVIGTHLLSTLDFSIKFLVNEFLLVVIGVSVALFLNLFQDNNRYRNRIIGNMRDTERQLQTILGELSCYLLHGQMKENVWDDIIALEKKLETFMELAYEYQYNTWQSHPAYYIEYFEMRAKQCSILHNLHYEMKRIRNVPKQSGIIAEYISYLKDYITEMNDPIEQLERLEEVLEEAKGEELPANWEEFDSRAKLYHIIMDLEEFLIFKRRFVEELDERKLRIYWNQDMGERA